MRREDIILSALTKDTEYTKKVMPHLSTEFFQDSTEKILFSLFQDFYGKYEKLPTRDVLMLDMENSKIIPEDQYDGVKSTLKNAFNDTYEYDVQWLVDETEKFCKERAVYNAIMTSVKIINGDEKKRSEGEIPSMLQDALSISFDHAIGHDYFDDAAARFQFYSQKENKISCHIDLLNKITSGGMPRKSLSLLVAQTGGGKSLVMCSLAAEYLKQGLNVLYITLELAEERIAERIDANLFNVAIQDIKTLSEKMFLDKIANLKTKTHGKLKIKEYPTSSASAANFKLLIDDLIAKDGFRPDVVIVDYLGITASAKYRNANGVNTYSYQKSVAEELRALAVEYDLLLISALQTNRSGFNTSDFDMDSISDSTGPSMTADLLLAIIRTPELDEINQFILKQLKNRWGDPNYYKRFVVGLDKSRMKIYNVEQNAQADLVPEVGTSSDKPQLDRYNTKKKEVKADEWDFE